MMDVSVGKNIELSQETFQKTLLKDSDVITFSKFHELELPNTFAGQCIIIKDDEALSSLFKIEIVLKCLLDIMCTKRTTNSVIVLSNKNVETFTFLSYANALTVFQKELPYVPILFCCGQSCLLPLPPGETELDVLTHHEGDWCGLIPLGKPVKTTTTGFCWNLNDQILAFGVLISTSNKFDGSGKVYIKNNNPLILTMHVKYSITR